MMGSRYPSWLPSGTQIKWDDYLVEKKGPPTSHQAAWMTRPKRPRLASAARANRLVLYSADQAPGGFRRTSRSHKFEPSDLDHARAAEADDPAAASAKVA